MKVAVCVGAVILGDGDLIASVLNPHKPGRGWHLPGGGLETGEDPLDGTYREIEEEVGVPRERLFLAPIPPYAGWNLVPGEESFSIVYKFRLTGGILRPVEPDTEVAWSRKERMLAETFGPFYRRVFPALNL